MRNNIIDGVDNLDIGIQRWALAKNGPGTVLISTIIKQQLDACNVPYDCECDDCPTEQSAGTNEQLQNSIRALMLIIQDLENRLTALETP